METAERRRQFRLSVGRMKKLRSPLKRAGLGQRRLQRHVLRAPEVHPVAQPQHRPVFFAASHGQAHTRTPVVAQAGQLLGQRQIRIAGSVAIGGGNCSRSQRNPAETTSSLFGCHWAVAYPAQSLVLNCQLDGPMVCE